MIKNTHAQYGSLAKIFHWLIFILVFCMLFGFFMGDISNKSLRGEIINIHKLTGLVILFLMLLRAAWALMNPKPVLPVDMPAWQKWSAYLVHFLLYVFLIAMPLSGWMMTSYSGRPPHIFSWMLGLPLSVNESYSDVFFTVHQTLAIGIIVLLCKNR